jgi:hypothetical protein
MSGDNDTYGALRIEDINGQEVVNIDGMSRYTTVKTFRRLVATRIRRSPEDVRLMAFGRLMDDGKAGHMRIIVERMLIMCHRFHIGRLRRRGRYNHKSHRDFPASGYHSSQ